MHKIFRSIIVAALFASAGAANALTTTVPGTLTGTYFSGNTFAAGAAINDTWNFTLGSSNFSGLAANFYTQFAGVINSFSATLTGSNGAIPWTFTNTTIPGVGGVKTLTYDGVLSAGSYSLNVLGTGGSKAGSYSLSLSAAPIPEPESYALFLAGLCLIGTIIRRRSKSFDA